MNSPHALLHQTPSTPFYFPLSLSLFLSAVALSACNHMLVAFSHRPLAVATFCSTTNSTPADRKHSQACCEELRKCVLKHLLTLSSRPFALAFCLPLLLGCRRSCVSCWIAYCPDPAPPITVFTMAPRSSGLASRHLCCIIVNH